MHVALFTDLHPDSLGGAQVSVATQRRALERRGHRVTVFTAPLRQTVDPDPCVVELRPVPVVAPLMRKLGRHDDFMFVWPSKTNRAIIDEAFGVRKPVDIVHTQGDLGVAIAGVEAATVASAPPLNGGSAIHSLSTPRTFARPISIRCCAHGYAPRSCWRGRCWPAAAR